MTGNLISFFLFVRQASLIPTDNDCSTRLKLRLEQYYEYDVRVFENLVTRNIIISFYIMGGTELHDSTRQLQNSKHTNLKTTFSSSVVSSGMQLNLFPKSNSILSILCRGRNSSSGRGWSSSWASGSSHPAHLQFGAWTRWNQILVQPCSTRYRAGKGFCSEEMDQLKWISEAVFWLFILKYPKWWVYNQ